MSALRGLVRGAPGKPLHPPLTDAGIGAYTAGVAMLVLGALGVQEAQMAHGALLAISFGLVVAAPTAITGLLDWLAIPKGTPARTMATVHLVLMVAATVVFALAWLAQRPGYVEGRIPTPALILGLVAEGLLVAGGNIGGANVFVYGIRVLNRPDTPVAKALNPLGLSSDEPAPGPAVPTPKRGEEGGG